jgi:hypothetical protein
MLSFRVAPYILMLVTFFSRALISYFSGSKLKSRTILVLDLKL